MVISSTNITKSKINYIVISILGIAILTTLVWAGITINRYAKVEKLCREIKAGKTIETSMADGTTAPVFFHNICTIMQSDVVKIPLVEACYWGNVQAVETLLNNGANPNYSLRDNWTPIEAAVNGVASKEDCFTIMKLLVEHGANVDQYESTEPVLFTLAARLTLSDHVEREKEMILWLLKNGAKSEKSPHNTNVLHLATRGTDTTFVTTLIEDYQFDVNAKGFEGQTPLIAALRYNNPCATTEQLTDMVNALILSGADVSVMDDNGKSAYDYAVERGLDDLALLLQSIE